MSSPLISRILVQILALLMDCVVCPNQFRCLKPAERSRIRVVFSRLVRLTVVSGLAIGWSGGVVSASAGDPPPVAGQALHLLKVNCLSCHNAEKRKGGLDMSTRDGLMKGGEEGPVVVEATLQESSFLRSMAADADPHMPPKKQLSADQIGVLAEWLRAGAPWDESVVRAGEALPRSVALGPLPQAYRPVMALALSPDGRSLAVGCGPEVVVFDVAAEVPIVRMRASAHLDPVQSLVWSPDGRRLITGAFRRVLVWNAATLTPEREILSGLTDRITAILVTPDGAQALVADGRTAENGVVRVVEVATGEVVRSWVAHGDTIFAMTLSADGRVLATAGGDALVRVWDVAGGRETAQLEAHATQVLCLSFNPDASQLVTGGADRLLKVWDVKTKENIVALATKPSAINTVAWSPTGPVVAGTADGSVFRYTDLKPHSGAQSSDTASEQLVGRVESSLNSLVATAHDERVFAGTSDGRLVGWNKEGKLIADIEIRSATVPESTRTAAASQ